MINEFFCPYLSVSHEMTSHCDTLEQSPANDHLVFSTQVAQLLSQRQWRPGAWFQFTQERMVDDPVYGQ